MLHTRFVDHLRVDEVHRQVLRQAVLHQFHQVLFGQLRCAQHQDADSMAIGYAVQRIRVLGREEVGHALTRRGIDEVADKGGSFRACLSLIRVGHRHGSCGTSPPNRARCCGVWIVLRRTRAQRPGR